VQGGLAVEEDEVARAQVALDAVADLEPAVGVGARVREVDAPAVRAHDALGARLPGRGVRPRVRERLQARAVAGRDGLGKGEVERDRPGHAQLVDADVGVARDDGARGKVDALAHEVTAHAPALALEARADGLDGPPAALQGRGLAGQAVVEVGRQVELQQRREFT
jgi:hypothetical protein